MQDQANAAQGTTNPLLAQFENALERENYPEALLWLQSSAIASSTAIARPELRDAYARLLALLAYQGIEISLHCGNILKEHGQIASQILTTCQQLLALTSEEEDGAARSALAIINGLSGQLHLRVSEFNGRSANSKFVVTTPPDLDSILEPLFGILEQCRFLTASRQHPIELDERAGAITDAISNSDCYLVGWPLGALSDWDKAAIMCRRASQLLSPPASCCAPDAGHDACDTSQLRDTLIQAGEACARHDYKAAKRLIKAAEGELSQVSCI